MREKKTQLIAVAVAVVLVGLAVFTTTGTASRDGSAAPYLAGPADLWRYGVAGLPGPVSSFLPDLQAMGVHWYQNWSFNPAAGAQGLDYYPMANLSSQANGNCDPSGGAPTLASKIRSGVYAQGTTWLIGNEVGASWSGATQSFSPSDYAQRYHSCYLLLKGLRANYTDIATHNFQVANGAILPSSGPYNGANNGLDWFRAARTAYQSLYGQPMPVDVYNIHLYMAPNDTGYYWLIHDVTAFRSAMSGEWHDQQKPVIVTEMGVRETVSWDASVAHLKRAVDYLATAADTATGYAADSYHLVQRWAWYTGLRPAEANGSYWMYTNLYNGVNARSPLGDAYAFKANATPTATPTRTKTPTITPTPTPYLQRVNAGGAAYTDVSGKKWAADQPFSPGSWGYINGTPTATTDAITGTDDPALYQDYLLYGTIGNAVDRFTVPNGQYDVTLRFSEDTYDQAGQRVFDVSLEKSVLLADFDIYAEAGGKGIAIDKVLRTNVTDGVLHILFTPKVGQPKVDAIAVQWAGIALTPTPTNTAVPTSTPTATSTKTPVSTRTRTSTPTRTRTTTPTRTPTSPPAATPYVMRINAGGGAYFDTLGNKWRLDRAFVTGSFGYAGGTTSATPMQVSGTSDVGLFQTARQWTTSAQPAYKFTVPNGIYTVRLRFAETEFSQAGRRVFDIKMKGIIVLPGFDIYAVAGGAGKAVDEVFNVTVLDGILNIQFGKITGNPIVNAIEVRRVQ